jgi:hypothetical protein
MNKAQIIAELENMVVARLFGGQPWLADPETRSTNLRKLIEMGLLEQVRDEPSTWRMTPLGKELDVDLFDVFMGIGWEWEFPITLEEYGLLSESEADAIFECASEADAESLLSGYVKQAYFDYRSRRAKSEEGNSQPNFHQRHPRTENGSRSRNEAYPPNAARDSYKPI